MFGMHLFTRAMNWGKNHPCLHSSKGWKLSLGPHPRSYTCEHIFWSTGTLVLSTLSSHCSMRAGQFWSHCSQKAIRRWDSIVSGSSSSGVTERQKYSSRIQGPCSVSSLSVMADVLAAWWMTPNHWPWWASLCHISVRISQSSGSTHQQIRAISCDSSRGKMNMSATYCPYFWGAVILFHHWMGWDISGRGKINHHCVLVAIWVFLSQLGYNLENSGFIN